MSKNICRWLIMAVFLLRLVCSLLKSKMQSKKCWISRCWEKRNNFILEIALQKLEINGFFSSPALRFTLLTGNIRSTVTTCLHYKQLESRVSVKQNCLAENFLAENWKLSATHDTSLVVVEPDLSSCIFDFNLLSLSDLNVWGSHSINLFRPDVYIRGHHIVGFSSL